MPGDIDNHVNNIEATKQYWKSISENHLPVQIVDIPQFPTIALRPSRSPKSEDDSNGSLSKRNKEIQLPKDTTEIQDLFKTETSTSNPFSFLKRLTRTRTATQNTITMNELMTSQSKAATSLSRSCTEKERRDRRELNPDAPDLDFLFLFPCTKSNAEDPEQIEEPRTPRESKAGPKKHFSN
jgi:hypothetical protein